MEPDAFARWSGAAPGAVWFAPGRVNLIGEHTDHSGGLVLPFAIGPGVTVAVRRTSSDVVRLRSTTIDDECELTLPDARAWTRPWRDHAVVPPWTAYVAGALVALEERGDDLDAGTGWDVLVDADLPAGSGLSSSAALECASISAFAAVLGVDLPGAEVARLARLVEHTFVGVPCGPMDQLASVFGRPGAALLIDCSSLTVEPVPFDPPAAGLAVVLIDTRTRHALGDGAYAARVADVTAAAAALDLDRLADATPAAVEAAPGLAPELRRRARHVATENERVRAAARSLRAGRPADIGPILTAAHESLRDDFEVSCPELDTAVEAAVAAGALGARMVGAGFGGSALALVAVPDVAGVVAATARAFATRGWAAPACSTVAPSAGCRRA